MTRLWVKGNPIKVQTNEQSFPHTIIWNGEVHPIAEVVNRWRVDVEWWRWHLWRDYFQVVTQSGFLIVIYHDKILDQWYLQRLYD